MRDCDTMKPRDPPERRKLHTRLRGCEAALRRERETFGAYRDGAGRRYLLGPLHLVLDDLDGAAEAFRWFAREFPDDCGEPGHFLCWTLALARTGDEVGAAKKLRQTMLSNLYVIPHLLGHEVARLDLWHSSSDAQPDYVSVIPAEYFGLWSPAEREWAERLYHSAGLTATRERYIEIYRALRHLAPGPERNRLVAEAFALAR